MGDRASLLGPPETVGRTRIGVGHAHGTFGELLQGVLPDNDLDFLVTFPIAERSTATFRPDPDAYEVTVYPRHKRKSAGLAQLILHRCGFAGGGLLEIDSGLPEGKGLASSSADLVATARAIGDAYGSPFPPQIIESFLRHIEPSDGVMYEGIVAFYHREVRLRERLGTLPAMTIVANDGGGIVDTVDFNNVPKPFDGSDKREYARLLGRLAAAVGAGDLHTVGQVATRSATMNAKLVPHPNLAAMHRLCREIDGYGLVLAHSGTMIGILIDGHDPDSAAKIDHVRAARRRLPGRVSVYRSLGPESHPAPGRPVL